VSQLKTTGDTSIEVLADARLDACSGFVGRFETEFEKSGQKLHRQVASIVIAEDGRRKENIEDYALLAGPSVRSLSEAVQALKNDPGAFAEKQIVFLHGLTRESEPVVAAEIMHSARALQALAGTRVHVLTCNLKVAGSGLEALYRETKAAGVLFFKFNDSLPTIRRAENDGWEVEFRDEVTAHSYRIAPDVIVVDETIIPSAYLEHLAGIMGLDTDSAGFLQTENVHRLPVFTNRRGILAVGPARAAMSADDSTTDAACGTLAVLALGNTELHRTVEHAEINNAKCIRCLTCYRLCPYGSIKRGNRIEVAAEACAGCGICFAECPRQAIRLGNVEPGIGDHLRSVAVRMENDNDPAIVAFCCSRSAGQANDLAVKTGLQIPANLKVVTVPCAGTVSTAFILEAFSQGAAGVMVLTCHDGNCHSETGNQHARRRVEHLSGLLGLIGHSGDRVTVSTLAANMETEFGQITRCFTRKLQQMDKPCNRKSPSQPEVIDER
jgi:coenzyme F420-reducing hydrogenase delta subunit/Pyruvate/2-oxoacid:ferredoxin oxidoreductase delta subunit